MSLKLLVGFICQGIIENVNAYDFGQVIFRSTTEWSLPNFISILYQEIFMLCKKAVYNDWSLETNTLFDLQLRTKAVPLSFFNSYISSVGW